MKIKSSVYNPRYKLIRGYSRPKYLVKRSKKKSQRLIARARCGNMEEWNRYWMKEEFRGGNVDCVTGEMER
ncbi:hypothetical protein QLX08_005940 [Tetragonisca angustula]|uniref:Uncharacterized protein n=1 Tax=Tetragonisca angustula TaxID=166442 RepID=A0AAW0ZXP6_9HYME